MIPIFLPFALLAPLQQPVEFLLLHKAREGEPIAFVHVAAESPALELGVYSDRGRVAFWPPTPGQGEPIRLEFHEEFFLDPTWRVLGVRGLDYLCKKGATLLGYIDITELRLPEDFPIPLPPEIDRPPRPNPPPPVAGACAVDASADGSVLVFRSLHHGTEQPSRVTIFRRDPSRDFEYVLTAGFVGRTLGEVSMSRDGRVIARRDGRELKLSGPDGVDRAQLPLGRSFAVGLDARWLVRWSSTGATFTRLDAEGVPSGTELERATATPCIEVQLHGDWALVRERARVALVDLSTGAIPWSRSIAAGHYTSMDLLRPEPARTLVALGRRETRIAPGRGTQGFVPGLAQCSAEVVDVAGGQVAASIDVTSTAWTHDTPRVTLVGSPPRMIVTTTQSAHLSLPIL